MYAKHARELLENAKVYKTFDESVKDCSMVMGTTGIWEKARSDFRRVYLLDQAIRKLRKTKMGKDAVLGLLIGRDDIGLTVEELGKCDIVAHIGTNPDYPVLNLSHALAVLLYALTMKNFSGVSEPMKTETPDRKEMQYLFATFSSIVARKNIRNRKAVMNVFKRIITNAQPTKQELHALITALK